MSHNNLFDKFEGQDDIDRLFNRVESLAPVPEAVFTETLAGLRDGRLTAAPPLKAVAAKSLGSLLLTFSIAAALALACGLVIFLLVSGNSRPGPASNQVQVVALAASVQPAQAPAQAHTTEPVNEASTAGIFTVTGSVRPFASATPSFTPEGILNKSNNPRDKVIWGRYDWVIINGTTFLTL